jgi:hypothetical protein
MFHDFFICELGLNELVISLHQILGIQISYKKHFIGLGQCFLPF